MMKVTEFSKLTGVSVRTLHYYDEIGLLCPQTVTDAGYRLYDETALERLQQILFFRELQFPLKDIAQILDSPNFDVNEALEQQIALLKMKRDHLDNLLHLALGIQLTGVKYMDFKTFDTRNIDNYVEEVKARWKDSSAYQEFAEKTKNCTEQDRKCMEEALMERILAFRELRGQAPDSPAVQTAVANLQQTITDHCYHCTDEMLTALGRMYTGDGRFQHNIDEHCGEGTAALINEAIVYYCESRKIKNES